jgi:hypothetical protein
MTTAKRRGNQDDFGEFQLWLQTVGTLAKDGNLHARDTLWCAFNSLAWSLAKLARTENSVHSGLFQGVLQHCLYILRCGLAARDPDALTYTYNLALRATDLIHETANRESNFVAKFKATVSDWPTIDKPKTSRRPQALARFVLGEIRLYRPLLSRRGKIVSGDTLTDRTATQIRICRANELRKWLIELPSTFTKNTAPQWWKVGRRILKRYWKDNPVERDRDWEKLGENNELKSPENYATGLVRRAFYRLARAS